MQKVKVTFQYFNVEGTELFEEECVLLLQFVPMYINGMTLAKKDRVCQFIINPFNT